MSGSVTSLLIALLGILGTLASGLLAQRSAERAKAKELVQAERQRIDDREYQAGLAALETLRACCVGLNTAALDYHSELNRFRYALQADAVTDEMRTRLDEARREHRAHYSQAQMAVPDAVLAAATAVNIRLNRLYGVLKRLDGGLPPARPEESVDEARAHIIAMWDHLEHLQSVMRESVGVPGRRGTPPPS
ncbi:hypothetical protein ACIPSA_02165 [Streptomyces sp. NPDC086549]|uniref:hypothetical protein n=1 Tax=Streptomyces sp. NPDC086549 TaxID=3365752 RepID=UPI00381104F6